MRIWSIHPKYLDAKGLVALWRETLLAKNVFKGKTRGYRNHPQLNRFKQMNSPVDCINQYLTCVYKEATDRGYNFNKNKIEWDYIPATLTITTGQLKYEAKHLLNKLKTRDHKRYLELKDEKEMIPHPLFKIVEGDIEKWEMTENDKKHTDNANHD